LRGDNDKKEGGGKRQGSFPFGKAAGHDPAGPLGSLRDPPLDQRMPGSLFGRRPFPYGKAGGGGGKGRIPTGAAGHPRYL